MRIPPLKVAQPFRQADALTKKRRKITEMKIEALVYKKEKRRKKERKKLRKKERMKER